MRNFKSIDPISLKAFYYASQTLNFTKASDFANLTQSGISQHISKLEHELRADLFTRVGKKVFLTDEGRTLSDYCEKYIDLTEKLISKVSKESQVLKGLVSYAMPDSCLMTPHFQQLLEARVEFNSIELNVKICHSEEVVTKLLSGEIDFGFITKDLEYNDIEKILFAEEDHLLVASHKNQIKINKHGDLKTIKLINYPGMDSLFERWQKLTFPRNKPYKLNNLNICGEINSLSGAITMVTNNVGAGFFPKHCVENEVKLKQLQIIGQSKNNKKNPIYLVSLKNRKHTQRVKKIIDSFWELKQ